MPKKSLLITLTLSLLLAACTAAASPTAGPGEPLEDQHREPGAGEVGGGDEPVHRG